MLQVSLRTNFTNAFFLENLRRTNMCAVSGWKLAKNNFETEIEIWTEHGELAQLHAFNTTHCYDNTIKQWNVLIKCSLQEIIIKFLSLLLNCTYRRTYLK